MFLGTSRQSSLARLFSGVVVVTLLAGSIGLVSSDKAEASACGTGTAPVEGNGTSGDPYKIASRDNLIWVSAKTSSLNTDGTDRNQKLGAHYLVTADVIDLANCLWKPIGETATENSLDGFTGLFDGGSAEIRGLRVDQTDARWAGFFGLVHQAALRNITLKDVNVSYRNSTLRGTGGLTGSASNTQIVNSHVTGRIASNNQFTGGLIGATLGSSSATSISRSSVDAEVIGEDVNSGTRVGGLIGIVNRPVSITDSYASGSVTGRLIVGGLVGDAASTTTIVNSYSSASVAATTTGGDGHAGGLVGQVRTTVNITDAYARGEVSGDGNIGGLIGIIAANQTVNPSAAFWDKDGTDLSTSAGGFGTPKSLAEMQSFDTFGPAGAGWDITDGWVEFDSSATPPQIWGICSGSTHPFLLWEYESSPCVFPQSESGAPANEPAAEKRASSPAIHLDLQVTVGQRISGAPVVIGGEGLAGGSDYSLVVRSTPQTVDSGKASSLGNFSKRVSMPALAAGSHTLTLTAVAPDGSTLSLVQGFTVGADGAVTALGSPAGSTGSALPATGSDQLVMLWSVGLAMLMMVAGVSAVAASRTKRAHAEG